MDSAEEKKENAMSTAMGYRSIWPLRVAIYRPEVIMAISDKSASRYDVTMIYVYGPS